MSKSNKFEILAVLLLAIFGLVAAAQGISPHDLADPSGQFVEIDGTEVYYIELGEKDAPTVILLHGFGGSTFTWRDVQPALAHAGFHVVALDLPPFGLSAKSASGNYSHEAMADTVLGLIDYLEIDTATVVGHSMGGSVTALYAAKYPERVEKLVFVASQVEISDNKETSVRHGDLSSPFAFLATLDPNSPLAESLIRTFLTRERFSSILSSAYYNKDVVTEEVIAGYQKPLQIDTWAQGLLAFMRANSENPSFDKLTLQNIDVPVLIIWGMEDTWIPATVGEQLHETIPESKLILYPEVGHLPMEEFPSQFISDLITFLRASEHP